MATAAPNAICINRNLFCNVCGVECRRVAGNAIIIYCEGEWRPGSHVLEGRMLDDLGDCCANPGKVFRIDSVTFELSDGRDVVSAAWRRGVALGDWRFFAALRMTL